MATGTEPVSPSAPDGASENWSLELFSAAVQVDPPKKVEPGIRQGPWLSLDVHDGLPSVLVSQIASDGNGNLPLATHEGICTYDGAHLRLTRLPDGAGQMVPDLAIGPSRGMWLTTMSGQLQHYDGEKVEAYTSAEPGFRLCQQPIRSPSKEISSSSAELRDCTDTDQIEGRSGLPGRSSSRYMQQSKSPSHS